MARGVAAGKAVDRVGELGSRDASIRGQKFQRLIRGARRVGGDAHHLDTIAGRNQRRLGDRGRRFAQPVQRSHDLVVGKRQALTQRDGRAAMVDPDDK